MPVSFSRGHVEHGAGGDGGVDGVPALAEDVELLLGAASGSLVATRMPCRVTTSEGPWPSQPQGKDPGTAFTCEAGCGWLAEGCPKGFCDQALPVMHRVLAKARMTTARHAWNGYGASDNRPILPTIAERASKLRCRRRRSGPIMVAASWVDSAPSAGLQGLVVRESPATHRRRVA